MFSKRKVEKVKEYTKQLMNEIGCDELTMSKEIKEEQKDMLVNLSGEDAGATIFYALCIGFANGIKWERK